MKRYVLVELDVDDWGAVDPAAYVASRDLRGFMGRIVCTELGERDRRALAYEHRGEVDEDYAELIERTTMADEKLTPERAVRLLRAKAGELENWVLHNANSSHPELWQLTADIALIATLLADFMEHAEEAIAQAAKTATNKPSWRQRSDFGVVPREEKEKFVEGFQEGRPDDT